jgi:hypothetical protein
MLAQASIRDETTCVSFSPIATPEVAAFMMRKARRTAAEVLLDRS